MIELVELGGRLPGRRFQPGAAPVRLGRHPGVEVVLPEPGVWDRHAEIRLHPDGAFHLRGLGDAHLTVNQEPVQEHRLRGGDVLGIGSVRLQFGIRGAAQSSMAPWELGVGLLIAGVTFAAILTMSVLGS